MAIGAPHAGDRLIVGVDIGGTSTRVGLVDDDGAIAAIDTMPTPHDGSALVDAVGLLVERLVDKNDGEVASHLGGCGVGVPGRVDARGDLSLAVNLGISASVEFRTQLEARLGIPTLVANDVDVAALGATRAAGLDRGTQCYLNAGTGLAAGLVIDGRIHRGATGGAGEIGHLPIGDGDRPCPCGQRGCPETTASAASILARWDRPGDAVVDVWDAADAGNQHALTIRDGALDTIASLVWHCVLMLDADTIFIGGGLASLGRRVSDPVRSRLDAASATSPFLASYRAAERVRTTAVDVEYGVLGASWLVRSA